MSLCVLQPDYTASEVDYRHYDPPRDLAYKVKPGPPPARQGPGATSRPLSR